MFGLGAGELILILFLGLIMLGPKRIPELARTLGQCFREFQRAKDDFMHEVDRDCLEVKTDPIEMTAAYQQTDDTDKIKK